MKRILCFVIVLCLLPVLSVSESIDLSALSFEELRTLQTRISQELVTRPEWKEVPVPEGFYQVGVDIPVGKWEIRCGQASMFGYISVEYGKNVNASGSSLSTPMDFMGLIYLDGKGERQERVVLDLQDGYYIEIKMGQAIFSVPKKIDLGF